MIFAGSHDSGKTQTILKKQNISERPQKTRVTYDEPIKKYQIDGFKIEDCEGIQDKNA